MKIALITGASSGLGSAYVRYVKDIFPEIDQIWALARRKHRLDKLASEVRTVRIKGIECDLTDANDLEALRQRLREEKPEIMLLVNNAGCGFHGAFDSSVEAEQQRCVDLNVSALTRITRIALDYMPEGARVLNTCSISSFVPNANMAVYCASKAYVSFFSRALNGELKPTNRSSTIVCPAPMNTEFLTVGHIRGNSKTFEKLPYCNVDQVAKGALLAAKKRRAVYTPRAFYKFYRFLVRLLPDALLIKLAKT